MSIIKEILNETPEQSQEKLNNSQDEHMARMLMMLAEESLYGIKDLEAFVNKLQTIGFLAKVRVEETKKAKEESE